MKYSSVERGCDECALTCTPPLPPNRLQRSAFLLTNDLGGFSLVRYWKIMMICSMNSNTDFQKKIILKLNSLSNIHFFKFAIGCRFHIILPSKRTRFSLRQSNFQNFLGGAWTRTPLEARTSGARLVRLLVGSHPPAKKKTCLRPWSTYSVS